MSALLSPIPLDRVRDGERIEVEADEAARAAIAARLDLLALRQLAAQVTLVHDGAAIRASGRLKAALDQACVATGGPVAAMVDEPFDLVFRAEPRADPDEEIELDPAELDTIFHDGRTIDLAAAIEDTLALALDPYPRSAGADAALREAGVVSEEEAGPFAALAALKERMARGSDG